MGFALERVGGYDPPLQGLEGLTTTIIFYPHLVCLLPSKGSPEGTGRLGSLYPEEGLEPLSFTRI
jgi:hypothetical protein